VYSFNKRLYIDSIKSGVKHLYSLRYAYNNLNLSNIIVGEDNTPIIIDLGSCKRFSKALISRGICG
jgi:serine/threonine protein kinase